MEIVDDSFFTGNMFNSMQVIIKRFIDVLFSLLLLVLLMPVIFLTAILILLESPGNPIFTQKRVGKNGRLFTIYKIRTLYKHHFGEIQEQEEPHAYRITPIGKYLRRSKLDELPQLLNILLGDMSFIGPRPYTQFDFDEDLRFNRVLMKPGLTGLAQISGNNYLGKSNIAWMDMWYIKNYSLLIDVKILFFTFPAIVKGEHKLSDPFNLHSKLPVKNFSGSI